MIIKIHPSLREFFAVVTKKRGDGRWLAYLEKLAHRAFTVGETEQQAVDNLARHVAANGEVVRRSAKILGAFYGHD